jgi:ribosomal protein S18 acetylase RimI-like enzyme
MHVATFKKWSEVNSDENRPLFESVKEIFFLSSARKTFLTPKDKIQFFEDWTSYYFESCPDLIFLALDSKSKVLGYLMGAPDSKRALNHYQTRVKSFAVFKDQFDRYPAHLHINLHPEARGQGLGSKLIDHFAGAMRQNQVPGVHIVTSPTSRNVQFYRQNQFDFELERPFHSARLLFMARSL